MRICALIPAFNEAHQIGGVIRGVREHIAEVVLIDDGSCDGTGEAGRSAGAVCLRSEQNRGKASALRMGIEFARERDFSHVLFLDGDGQHRAEDIPTLIRAARETGADLVIGTRSFDRKRMPLARYYSNTVGSKIASWLAGTEIRDSQSGFRLVRMDKLRQLRLRGRKYELEMEILIKMSRAGFTTVHAPVQTVYENGQARSKMRPIRDTMRICFWSLAFRFLGW